MKTTCALLVPCKNGASYLPRLFASVRAQTRPFNELWVFDDGSTDDTSQVAGALGAKVIRSETSLGPSAARNRLIDASESEWLHFHDADDTLAPLYLERVMKQAVPPVSVVVCDMEWRFERTGQLDMTWRYDEHALNASPTSYLVQNTIGGINGLYRRDALRRVHGFDESLSFWEDLDLNLRLARNGTRYSVVNEFLVTAFRRENSHSNSSLPNVWTCKLRLMEGLLAEADSTLRSTIAREAETIAERLAQLGAWPNVAFALQIARRAGANPPTTRNLLVGAAKRVVPSTWAFRLQYGVRKMLSR